MMTKTTNIDEGGNVVKFQDMGFEEKQRRIEAIKQQYLDELEKDCVVDEYVGRSGAIIREVVIRQNEDKINDEQPNDNKPDLNDTIESPVKEANPEIYSKENEKNDLDLFIDKFSYLVCYKSKLIIIAVILLVGISASGMMHFKFNEDYRVYFSKENPQLRAFESLERIFTEINNVIFVIAPKNGDVFTKDNLSVIEQMTRDALKEIPYNSRVDSLTNYQYTNAVGDDLEVSDLVENAQYFSAEKISEIKQFAINSHQLKNRIVSVKGHVAGINVNVVLPERSSVHNAEVATEARALIKRYEQKYPNIDFYLSGTAMMDDVFAEAATQDMSTLTPLMYSLVLFVTWWILRSLVAVVSVLLVVSFSSMTAVGIASWLGIEFTTASLTAPTVILTLAVADSIHFLESYYFLMRSGYERKAAIKEALHLNMTPIFITSITTMIGFLSMNFSDAPPFHDLGNIVAIGVLAALVYSVLFIPAFIMVMPEKIKQSKVTKFKYSMRDLSQWIINRKNLLFYSLIGVAIILSTGIFKIELDDVFVNYFDTSFKYKRDTDYLNENLTGIDTIGFAINTANKDGIYDPEYMYKVDQFSEWLRAQDNVVHVNTITDTIKRLNSNMHSNDAFFERLPETKEENAQYLLLYEMSLPRGFELTNQLNLDKSMSLVTVTMNYASTQSLIGLEEEATYWLEQNMPSYSYLIGSPSLMFAHISERNVNEMLAGTLVALLLISGILVIVLRSVKLGLISLVPNIIPAVLAFGLWGWLVGEVGLAVAVVATITLGIVVDDTVHFLSKYARSRKKQGLNPTEAIHYSFSTVGRALITTSVILISGFAILALSGFTVNSHMGILTSITIAFALMADFLLLPVLLLKLDKNKKQAIAA